MIFDGKEKNKMALVNFLPATILLLITSFYVFTVVPLGPQSKPKIIMNNTLAHYDTLLVMMIVFAIAAAIVLLYDIVLLAKFRNMDSGQKLKWILVLCAFVPLSFPLFWYFVIRREPRVVPVYANMD